MFNLKKVMMQATIGLKKAFKPFDYEQAEAFVTPTNGDGNFNNSYYFSAHSYEKQESLYTRLGLRDDGSAEVWAYFCKGEKIFVLKDIFYKADESPLKIKKENDVWSFTFSGELTDESGKKVTASMDCRYFSQKQAVDFFYHMPTLRIATAMAQDKWSKEFFAGIKENNSVHYEQEGVLIGKVIIDNFEYEIDLPCLRDHSFGKREWNYMNNHLWLAGVDKDCQFNFSMVSYPSLSVLEEGHLREKNRGIEYVTKAHYDRNQIVTGEVPQSLELDVEINEERTIKVKANFLHGEEYLFGNGDYRFIEGIAEYEVDGIKCRGILEIGFNKDKSRFMNGKKIEDIIE